VDCAPRVSGRAKNKTTLMNTKERLLHILVSESAEEFSRLVDEAEAMGLLPLAPQSIFFNAGFHVAYYVNPHRGKPLEPAIEPEPPAASRNLTEVDLAYA
jgi:hypothetical protein